MQLQGADKGRAEVPSRASPPVLLPRVVPPGGEAGRRQFVRSICLNLGSVCVWGGVLPAGAQDPAVRVVERAPRIGSP